MLVRKIIRSDRRDQEMQLEFEHPVLSRDREEPVQTEDSRADVVEELSTFQRGRAILRRIVRRKAVQVGGRKLRRQWIQERRRRYGRRELAIVV